MLNTISVCCQSYTDVVQLYRSDRPLDIENIIVDNNKRYLIIPIGEHSPGEKIYFNDDHVFTLETELIDDSKGLQMRLVIEINNSNEYVNHTVVTYDQKDIIKLKVIDDEIYCLLSGESFQYEVIRYNDGIHVDTLFVFPDSQRVWIEDFTLSGNKLLVGGTFLGIDQYIYYNLDTLWNPEPLSTSNYPDFIFCKNVALDSIIYGLSYGGKYYGIALDGLEFDDKGNAFVWGKHSNDFSIQGDTSDYKGSGPGDDDAYLFRLDTDGSLIKLHSFSSTSSFDCLQSFWEGNEGSYYVTYTSGPSKSTYIDKVVDYEKVAPYLNYSTIYKFDEEGNIKWSLPLKNIYGIGSIVYGEDDEYIYALADLASHEMPLKIDDLEYSLDNAKDKESYTFLLKLDKSNGDVIELSKPIHNGKGVRYSTGLYRDSPHSVVLRFKDTDVKIEGVEYPKYVEGYNMDALINVDFISPIMNVEQQQNITVYPNQLSSGDVINIKSNAQNPINYQIISVNGTIIQSGKVIQNQIVYKSITGFSGIYFLMLTQNNETSCYPLYISNL